VTEAKGGPRKYILDGHTPVPCDDLMQWAEWFTTADRQVALDHVGDVRVSTVFLAIDHRHFGDGPPLLFETMIFGGSHDQAMWRSSTWKQAEQQHADACALAKWGLH
jgi:hypothetical protein